MAVLTGLLMSNSGEKYHQKCALSTPQINFRAFFIVSYLIKSMVLLLSLKWSWHKLPKSCRSQWSLQKVFAFVATQFRRVTSVLLTELNIYTIMFPYLPNPTKWRFLVTIIEVLVLYIGGKRSCVTDIYFSPVTRKILSTHQVCCLFFLIVLTDFNSVWCKNAI